MNIRISRLGLAVAMLAGASTIPMAAQAQQTPSYATTDAAIHGTVAGFDGKYGLTVRDDRGFTDRVVLHDGTVINPTGLRLAGGMTVTIHGRPDGSQFDADEIDTPYHRTFAYGYPGYGPYPYYGPRPYYGPYYGVRAGFFFR